MIVKKSLAILVVGFLVLSGFGAFALDSDKKELDSESIVYETLGDGTRDFTHTVFGEYGTATWCGYCKYAHGALKELYAEDQLDFYYVSLVCDKNGVANNRVQNDYNLYGYPTVWWDGGDEVDVGASSVPGAKTEYTSGINSCGSRTVEDITIDLAATWLGGTEMEIECTVYNNEGNTYGGTIRVYITEISSSEGWTDTAGDLYTFAFLDWAFNEDISIPVDGSWSDSMTWDGSSHGYSDVTADNTMIIAAVFNDEWHQGYSRPPNQNPFDAYYVDETVGLRVGNNQAPYEPSNPVPSNGATDVSITPSLSWDGGDPDWFDDVYYDVYFEKDDSTPDVLVSDDQTVTTYEPGTLELDSTYYWQIVSKDEYGATTTGPVWSFTTRDNDPPYTPSNPDPADGATDVSLDANLEWDGGDPDGDSVTYDVYFGDSSPPPLVSSDQSNTTVLVKLHLAQFGVLLQEIMILHILHIIQIQLMELLMLT
jgi:thiol-disulfide isomerase/thioredoxin